ncbi:MAG: transcription-repair coupling factor [Anaerolineae bacterium]
MKLHGLLAWIREHPHYRRVRDDVLEGHAQPPHPILPAAGPALLAALSEDLEAPTLIVVPTGKSAQQLVQALQLWMENPERLLVFPAPPALPYERTPWPPEVIADRLNVLATLFLHRVGARPESAAPVVVASVHALMQRPLPYRQFRKAARKVQHSARTSLTGLARHCQQIGYDVVSVVSAPGQISRRGGLLDVYPPHAPHPYRLDFFGDEIDAIRVFDPATQRSRDHVAEFWITPVREALPRDAKRALPQVQSLLDETLPPEVSKPLAEDAEALAQGAPFPTLEFYLPTFYQEIDTLLSYLPLNAHILLYRSDELRPRWHALEAEAEAQKTVAPLGRRVLARLPGPYVPWERWQAALEQKKTLAFTFGKEGPLAEMFAPEPHFAGKLGEALGRLRQWTKLGDQVVVVSRQAARLTELWRQFNPPPVQKSVSTPPETLLTFVQGIAPAGWQLTDATRTRHLLTDEEIFGWRPPEPRRRPRRRARAPEFDFSDLEPDTPVVHEDYGVGIFRGLVERSVDNIQREYLLVEYAAGDRLFVPIHQADRLTRYVGREGWSPPLSRLDSARWQATKARVREAATELAAELLELYAKRQTVQGHAFAPDTPWQADLEASFPYLETEDQLEAIEAVKKDMESHRPMDRLICGDSGYGKTEVALRAAFKAVMDNKQVAMLVPTTVLAQQHFHTFRERLEPFPVNLELLSRFRSSAEQREIVRQLREGTVDIVIGTHRLLQDDVRFKDLGLVIIDEEQRFGVAHKERLKEMRTEVDVLTLTATPIPRTLYMSLTGVRDISLIETPPEERLPISTYVGPYDANVVRRAVLREMQRGGQTFYVHNRIQTIHTVRRRLEHLVPEARVGVAHGRMHEQKLADVMEAFTTGELDVLVATTIIESGLDIPNANTLIVEQADNFGLAQLYQLRGRVGRGNRRAYAYLFHNRRLKEEAEQRLEALQTRAPGGGFAIALRDLELRGAGEILGAQQHGHIAAVGFTLYTQMLTRAVKELQAKRAGEPPPPEPVGAITIELPLDAGLPPDYVPDARLRLQLYRRLADLTDEEEITRLAQEFRDRFGPLPQTAEYLFRQLRLKVLARDAHIPAITVSSGQIILRPPWLRNMDPSEIGRLQARLGRSARVGHRDIWLPLTVNPDDWLSNLAAVLKGLAAWWEARHKSI